MTFRYFLHFTSKKTKKVLPEMYRMRVRNTQFQNVVRPVSEVSQLRTRNAGLPGRLSHLQTLRLQPLRIAIRNLKVIRLWGYEVIILLFEREFTRRSVSDFITS